MSDFDRSLIDAAREELAPTAQEKDRLRASVLAAGAGAAAAAAGGGTAVASSGAAGAAAASGAVATWKVVAVVVVAAAAGTATVHRAMQSPESSAPAAAAPTEGERESAANATEPARPVETVDPAEALAPPVELEDTTRTLAPARHQRTAAPPPPAATTEDPRPPSTLDEETLLLGRAQAALRAGRTDAALAVLAQHAERFPHGDLGEERDATEVLALCAADRVDAARSAAQRFLATHAQSIYAARVRTSCALTH